MIPQSYPLYIRHPAGPKNAIGTDTYLVIGWENVNDELSDFPRYQPICLPTHQAGTPDLHTGDFLIVEPPYLV